MKLGDVSEIIRNFSYYSDEISYDYGCDGVIGFVLTLNNPTIKVKFNKVSAIDSKNYEFFYNEGHSFYIKLLNTKHAIIICPEIEYDFINEHHLKIIKNMMVMCHAVDVAKSANYSTLYVNETENRVIEHINIGHSYVVINGTYPNGSYITLSLIDIFYSDVYKFENEFIFKDNFGKVFMSIVFMDNKVNIHSFYNANSCIVCDGSYQSNENIILKRIWTALRESIKFHITKVNEYDCGFYV